MNLLFNPKVNGVTSIAYKKCFVRITPLLHKLTQWHDLIPNVKGRKNQSKGIFDRRWEIVVVIDADDVNMLCQILLLEQADFSKIAFDEIGKENYFTFAEAFYSPEDGEVYCSA